MRARRQLDKKIAKTRDMSRAIVMTASGMAITNPKEFIQLAAHAGDRLLKGEFSQAIADTYAF
jgi:hypothetical protein